MFKNVEMHGLEIYHPSNKVDNQYFINHFNNMGIQVEGLMNHLGRKERYLATENENSITMALESSKKALLKSNLSAEELDMIIFVSETPEYLVPTNALKLNNLLGAKNAHISFDLNDNCIGMLVAIDMVSRYMKNNNNVKNALIVGSLYISGMVRKDCAITYPNIADGSAAFILKSCESNKKRGFLDSDYYTNSKNHELMAYPGCGFSKIDDENISKLDKKFYWKQHDVSFFSDDWKNLIINLLDRNNLKPNDIDHYLISQFSVPDGKKTLEKLGVEFEKSTFVADKYGYTGCCSPFFALNDAIEEGKVKSGSTVIFCSVGGGYSMSSILFKI